MEMLRLSVNFITSIKVTEDFSSASSRKFIFRNRPNRIVKYPNMPLDDGKGNNPLTFATSTLGNATGGVAKTAGGIVGAAGRGVGQTVTGVTGSAGKPVGDALESVGNGVEGGSKNVAEGVEDAGKGKKDIFH